MILHFKLAESEAKKKSSPLRAKKLNVLAALLVEEHNTHKKQLAPGTAGKFLSVSSYCLSEY